MILQMVSAKRQPFRSEHNAELILGLFPASERLRYKVTPALIGWVQN